MLSGCTARLASPSVDGSEVQGRVFFTYPSNPATCSGTAKESPVDGLVLFYGDHGLADWVTTDDAGRFTIRLPKGRYEAEVYQRGWGLRDLWTSAHEQFGVTRQAFAVPPRSGDLELQVIMLCD